MRMLGVIDRYFLLEVFKVFFAVLGVVMLIVASLLFLRTLEQVNAGALGARIVLQFLGLQLARDTASLLPPVFFISVLVALGRMAKDSELIAFSACGLGPVRTYRALFYAALPVTLLTAWFALSLGPAAATEILDLRVRQQEQAQRIAGLKPGRFYQHENGQITVYIDKIESSGRLRDIFLHDRRGKKPKLVFSREGRLHQDEETGETFVELLSGRRYDGAPGRADYAIGTFERYRLRLEAGEPGRLRHVKRATYATAALIGSDDRLDHAELQHRLANPMAILVLTLVAVPLTAKSPRHSGSWRLFVAFLTYFSFFNLQRLATSWYESGLTPSWLGSLWYQALMLGLVFAVLSPDRRWLGRLRPGRRARAPAPGS